MDIFLFFIGICIGLFLGYSVIPIAKQKTKVIVDIEDNNVSFESNRLQNGDEYEIVLNKNIVSKGVVKNNKWAD